jgi:hypothetical protein
MMCLGSIASTPLIVKARELHAECYWHLIMLLLLLLLLVLWLMRQYCSCCTYGSAGIAATVAVL